MTGEAVAVSELEQTTNVPDTSIIRRPDKRHTQLLAEDLPLTVRIVRTPEQLAKVCELRASAYGSRMPQLGRSFAEPEEADFDPGTVVLIAESKETGETVGTLRIHTNLFQPVPMEGVVDLPEPLQGQLMAEACRFCIKGSFNSPFVRLALFKAIYLYCYANQVQFLLCVARRPLNEIYKSLGFQPLGGGSQEVWKRISYVGNIEHSLLMLDVLRVDNLWYEKKHPCYQFVRRTYHPDIKIFSAVSSVWARPRSGDDRLVFS